MYDIFDMSKQFRHFRTVSAIATCQKMPKLVSTFRLFLHVETISAFRIFNIYLISTFRQWPIQFRQATLNIASLRSNGYHLVRNQHVTFGKKSELLKIGREIDLTNRHVKIDCIGYESVKFRHDCIEHKLVKF